VHFPHPEGRPLPVGSLIEIEATHANDYSLLGRLGGGAAAG
jgi:hypothetical protein